MKNSALLICTFALLCVNATAQDLPRSASFGAMVKDVNDSVARVLHVPSTRGTWLKEVVPGSAAQAAGLSNNDVLVTCDSEEIKNTDRFLAILKTHGGGDKIKIGYYRQGKLKSTTVQLREKPRETSDQYDIIYSSVHAGNNHLRTIITKPKREGVYPAVLIIGGVGCYSIDRIFSDYLKSAKMWIDTLTMHGFVTIRVEKTGMGDSKGIPCDQCDFLTEKEGYLEGLRALKSLPFVNKENIFIAGFSMGGVIGPLIAQQEKVKGIIAYGTVGRNWLEYELENTHRQKLLDEFPIDSLDDLMRAEYKRLYGLFVEKKTPAQIKSQYPETSNLYFDYPMDIRYFQQVADVNIGQLWKQTEANVLVMHGSSDFVSSAAEHQLIADIVNRYHPGKGTYLEIPHSDHWQFNAGSEKESAGHVTTEVNPMAVSSAVRWLVRVVSA